MVIKLASPRLTIPTSLSFIGCFCISSSRQNSSSFRRRRRHVYPPRNFPRTSSSSTISSPVLILLHWKTRPSLTSWKQSQHCNEWPVNNCRVVLPRKEANDQVRVPKCRVLIGPPEIGKVLNRRRSKDSGDVHGLGNWGALLLCEMTFGGGHDFVSSRRSNTGFTASKRLLWNSIAN